MKPCITEQPQHVRYHGMLVCCCFAAQGCVAAVKNSTTVLCQSSHAHLQTMIVTCMITVATAGVEGVQYVTNEALNAGQGHLHAALGQVSSRAVQGGEVLYYNIRLSHRDVVGGGGGGMGCCKNVHVVRYRKLMRPESLNSAELLTCLHQLLHQLLMLLVSPYQLVTCTSCKPSLLRRTFSRNR